MLLSWSGVKVVIKIYREYSLPEIKVFLTSLKNNLHGGQMWKEIYFIRVSFFHEHAYLVNLHETKYWIWIEIRILQFQLSIYFWFVSFKALKKTIETL